MNLLDRLEERLEGSILELFPIYDLRVAVILVSTITTSQLDKGTYYSDAFTTFDEDFILYNYLVHY